MQPSLATSSFDALTKEQYFRDLIKWLKRTKSGDRALLTTMTIDPAELLVQDIVHELVQAAERGVIVDFAYDAYCYLINPLTKQPGPLYIRGTLPESPKGVFAAMQHIAARIEAAGGTVALTNLPLRRQSNPFSGRSHIKTAVINDRIYIGGCNLTAAEDIDLMTTFTHATTATWLYDTMKDAIHAPTIRESLQSIDQQYPIDATTTLLLDAGIRNQSAIYEHALRFIDEATDWLTMTCQYFPNDQTATRLLAAHRRGVKVKILYNNPRKHAGLQHKLLQSIVHERERIRLPASFFANQLAASNHFIHAKVLASEQGALIGSHNYVKSGVRFGTAELALLRYDPAFSHILAKSIDDQIVS